MMRLLFFGVLCCMCVKILVVMIGGLVCGSWISWSVCWLRVMFWC